MQVPKLWAELQTYSLTDFVDAQESAVSQAVLQQTPSAQYPLVHIDSAPLSGYLRLDLLQVEPLDNLATQAPEVLQ